MRAVLCTMAIAAAVALAACSDATAPAGGPAQVLHHTDVRPAVVLVHLGLFGGPARQDGTMALENAPYRKQVVRLIDAAGGTLRERTGANGVARFVLDPGRYRIGTLCGRGPRHVTARSGRTVRISLQCDVP